MDTNVIVTISVAAGIAVGAGGMWLRRRLARHVADERKRLLQHVAERAGRNVVGGPRWRGFPK